MAIRTLGLVTVTTGGTPVRATATQTHCQKVYIQANPSNTALGYVGLSGLNRTTFANVIAAIPAPAGGPPATSIQQVEINNEQAPNSFNLADLWFDAGADSQSFIVSYVQT